MRLTATVLLPLVGAVQATLVPAAPGPYSVAVKQLDLTDPSRIDPFAPEANTKRRILSSVYLPIDAEYGCETELVRYMPALTARLFGLEAESMNTTDGGTSDEYDIEYCNISSVANAKQRSSGHNHEKKQFPITIFSPGQGVTRLLYGAMARSVASFGYIVVLVDHTYEVPIVEFPNGDVVYGAKLDNENDTVVLQQLEVRTGDETFLIDQLNNATLTDALFADFPGTFNPKKVAVYGHSLGGATAAITCQRDARAIGGLDLDGTIFGPVGDEGFAKPFVLVASAGKDNAPVPVQEWNTFYGKLTAAKIEVAVKDTTHFAYTDLPLLLSTLDLSPEERNKSAETVGRLPGRDVEKAVNAAVLGLFELLFQNNTTRLRHIGNDANVQVLLSDLPKSCK